MSLLAFALGFACLQTPKDIKPAEIRAKFFVLAYEEEPAGQVMLPVMRDYRGQVPVGFQLKVKPETMVESTKLRPTETGDTILEVKLKPMKRDQRIEVEWRSQLILDMNEKCAIPNIPVPDKVPSQVEQWLRPSLYVQSDHPAIRAKADGIKNGNLRETIEEALQMHYRTVRAQTGRAEELSSLTALTTKGSCTSEANLLAALLRAKGIAARLVAGYPTYAGRPYDTHYIVEAYCGDAGWIPADPGGMCNMMPVASVVGLANENQGERRIAAAAGVPFLSLTETSGKLIARGLLNSTYSEHEAKLKLTQKLDPALWVSAKARWAKWLEESRSSVKDLPASFKP